jgi:tripartite-type tricarboxylate transporter receptor subunit TctC
MSNRRQVLALGAAAIGAPLALPSFAQAFPSKPIRIFVPNAPGGAADITARTVGQAMSAALGQPVVVENRPGAGGVVAAETVSRAEPDGHTLLLVSSGTAVSASLFRQLPFDTLKDFAPVSMLATFNLVLVSSANGKFKTLDDVLAYAKANPGKLNIGSPQVGTTQNLAAELFKATAGIDAQVVPFNGTPPVINELRAGRLDVAVDILGALRGQLDQKALHPIAVLGDKPEASLPGVPLVRSAGGPLAQFNASSWNGLSAPAKTPQAAIDRLNKEINAALGKPDVAKKLSELSLNAQGSTPAQLGEHLAADIRKWAAVIERAKIPKQ